jgi:rhodanese-related sulfurtransferase
MRRLIGGTTLILMFAAVICHAAAYSLKQDLLNFYLAKGADFDFILIDLRSRGEIKAAIGNETCKPYNLEWPEQLKAECSKIPTDRTIILYCQSGGRAVSAANYLSLRGFTDVYNAGGILSWTGSTISPSEIKETSLLPEPSMRAAANGLFPSLSRATESRVVLSFSNSLQPFTTGFAFER